jgi:hypothetical protein
VVGLVANDGGIVVGQQICSHDLKFVSHVSDPASHAIPLLIIC